ncbi:hypothetical protein NQD34_001611 [Periophthalmus magnuspinnatus]|nr:hypothetical protein NQD34_001611 [Periophthalmus magnuspinnatus]
MRNLLLEQGGGLSLLSSMVNDHFLMERSTANPLSVKICCLEQTQDFETHFCLFEITFCITSLVESLFYGMGKIFVNQWHISACHLNAFSEVVLNRCSTFVLFVLKELHYETVISSSESESECLDDAEGEELVSVM